MELVKILKSVDIINDSVNKYEGKRPFLSTGDLNVSEISNVEYVTFDEKPSRANLNVNEGDIIVARMQGTTKVKLVEEIDSDLIVSTGFLVLRPKNNSNRNFLRQIFLSNDFQNEKDKLCTGATQKAINNGSFSKLEIPLPPLETQKHIAQILDDAAALRDKTSQLIKEYDALAQSIFLDMFGDPVKNDKGWEKVSLINLCKKIQIGPFGSQLHQADYKDCGIPLINPTNIKNGKVDYSKIAFISEKKYMSLPNYHLQVGDVLMARRGDLSKIGLVIDEKCFCGTGSLFLRPNQKLHPIYAISVLAHKSTIDKLYEKAQGITMANLNKSIVSSLEVTVPPITLQNQFAEKITLIEQQKELAKQELKESEDLFNCLLQKAFKGELV